METQMGDRARQSQVSPRQAPAEGTHRGGCKDTPPQAPRLASLPSPQPAPWMLTFDPPPSLSSPFFLQPHQAPGPPSLSSRKSPQRQLWHSPAPRPSGGGNISFGLQGASRMAQEGTDQPSPHGVCTPMQAESQEVKKHPLVKR